MHSDNTIPITIVRISITRITKYQSELPSDACGCMRSATSQCSQRALRARHYSLPPLALAPGHCVQCS